MDGFSQMLRMEQDAREARGESWSQVRAARLQERKYPHCPSTRRESPLRWLRRRPRVLSEWTWHKPVARVRWKQERMQKNWSEYDWWSIDVVLARMIAEVCRKYRDDGHGYQRVKEGEPEVFAVQRWKNILTEIADGFDGYAKEQLTSDSPEFKRAMKLFTKYFGALWD